MTNNNNWNWNYLHPSLGEEEKQQWISKGFSYQQTFHWLRNVGLRVDEADFATYLRDIRKKDFDWVLNYGVLPQLRSEYCAWKTNHLKKPTSNQLLTIVSLSLLTIYLLLTTYD